MPCYVNNKGDVASTDRCLLRPLGHTYAHLLSDRTVPERNGLDGDMRYWEVPRRAKANMVCRK